MIGGKPPKPPSKFIILKSILYQNCGGGFCSFTEAIIVFVTHKLIRMI